MYLKGKKNCANNTIEDKIGSLHAILKEMNGVLGIRDWIMPVLKKRICHQTEGWTTWDMDFRPKLLN